jgi:tRNA modification GTPase
MITIARDDQPIVACCTPQGKGALALIRVAGVSACEVVAPVICLSSGTCVTRVASHTVHHGRAIDPSHGGTVIDEVMVIVMRGPRTFTGQDTVEITCHNNPFIIQGIISVLIQEGARMAGPGEFARRAFIHGKIDLVQAEAIHEIINATNATMLRAALAQLRGSFSEHIQRLERSLIELLAFTEASFEFLDEEQRDIDFAAHLQRRVAEISQAVMLLKKDFDCQHQVREGVRVVIVGAVNAGKSTLFNALLGKQRAIVSPMAGTTRDSVEAGITREGFTLTMIDTAGLRATNDHIEREGIERSWHEVRAADVIIITIDLSRLPTDEEMDYYKNIVSNYAERVIVVGSKADNEVDGVRNLVNQLSAQQAALIVSAQLGKGIGELTAAIIDKVRLTTHTATSPYLLNQRHYIILLRVAHIFDAIVVMCNQGHAHAYELIAYHIREALEEVAGLTGKGAAEQAFDLVFERFCVGK